MWRQHVFLKLKTQQHIYREGYGSRMSVDEGGEFNMKILYASGANNKVITDDEDEGGVVNFSRLGEENKTSKRAFVCVFVCMYVWILCMYFCACVRVNFTVVTRCPLLQKLHKWRHSQPPGALYDQPPFDSATTRKIWKDFYRHYVYPLVCTGYDFRAFVPVVFQYLMDIYVSISSRGQL